MRTFLYACNCLPACMFSCVPYTKLTVYAKHGLVMFVYGICSPPLTYLTYCDVISGELCFAPFNRIILFYVPLQYIYLSIYIFIYLSVYLTSFSYGEYLFVNLFLCKHILVRVPGGCIFIQHTHVLLSIQTYP